MILLAETLAMLVSFLVIQYQLNIETRKKVKIWKSYEVRGINFIQCCPPRNDTV